MVASAKFRGDFKERIKSLLESLKNNENAILFIDEIHTIIDAGSIITGALNIGNLLKPSLAKGELSCVDVNTFTEYPNHFKKDVALARHF